MIRAARPTSLYEANESVHLYLLLGRLRKASRQVAQLPNRRLTMQVTIRVPEAIRPLAAASRPARLPGREFPGAE
jgi:hypothetical protein